MNHAAAQRIADALLRERSYRAPDPDLDAICQREPNVADGPTYSAIFPKPTMGNADVVAALWGSDEPGSSESVTLVYAWRATACVLWCLVVAASFVWVVGRP